MNTGITSTLYQLFPPALLQQLSGSFGGQPILLQSYDIDDRGDLLVTAGPGNGPSQEAETFLLTPPGLAPPTPTPEPSSLLIFGLIAGALGLRTAVRRSRGCTGE